jgi:hypothetical protein
MHAEPPMKIQEESPLPTNPLDGLEDDYGHAVLHVAWDRHSETKELTLLFAFVELLPTEIPPPIDDYDFKAPRSSHRLGSDSKHCIYVRHAVMTARQGLDWYLACRVGTAVLPWPKGSPLKLADLGEEPPWPTLVSASDDSDAIPFVPQWIHCPRTHHLLPLVDFDLGLLWSAEEREKAQGWLEDRLHFDLGEYPEYWGSVHLVAPNPVYRKIRTRLQRREPPAQSIVIQFQPRARKSAQGLDLIFRAKDPWGVTASPRATVERSLLRFHFDNGLNDASHDVLDPTRGFLQTSNYLLGFFDSFSSETHFAQTVLVKGPKSSYEVTKLGKPHVSTFSVTGATQKVNTAHSRMISADIARRQRGAAKSHGQRWFKDQKDEARNLLRSLLNEANSNVLLIDPYFGAEELGEIMLAVGREDIPIRILSSSELRKSVSEESKLDKGNHLFALLQKIRSQQRMNPFEIRVMPGARPAIHDRFLIIDKRIWLLGSSLNEFGSRGTMLLALPDPDAVRDDLMKAWNDSEALEVWIERQQKRAKAKGGTS